MVKQTPYELQEGLNEYLQKKCGGKIVRVLRKDDLNEVSLLEFYYTDDLIAVQKISGSGNEIITQIDRYREEFLKYVGSDF